MDESQLSKAKDYSIKFPREIIESALFAFMKDAGLLISSTTQHSVLTIEANGESWGLPNQEVFLSEYAKEISSARLSLAWSIENKQLNFAIRFRHDLSGSPSTRIEISLDSRAAIDRVFRHFQDFYDHDNHGAGSAISRPVFSSYSLTRRLPSVSIKPQVLHQLEALMIGLASEFDSGFKPE